MHGPARLSSQGRYRTRTRVGLHRSPSMEVRPHHPVLRVVRVAVPADRRLVAAAVVRGVVHIEPVSSCIEIRRHGRCEC